MGAHETGAHKSWGRNLVLQDFGDSDKKQHESQWFLSIHIIQIFFVFPISVLNTICTSPFSSPILSTSNFLWKERKNGSGNRKLLSLLRPCSSWACSLQWAAWNASAFWRPAFLPVELMGGKGRVNQKETGMKSLKSLEVLRMSSMISWRWFQMISKNKFLYVFGLKSLKGKVKNPFI